MHRAATRTLRPVLALALVLALSQPLFAQVIKPVIPKVPNIWNGLDAISKLTTANLTALVTKYRRTNDLLTTTSLTALLKADLDLVVNTKTLTLNYACSGLSLGTNVTRPKGRRMLHDHHHHHLHGHSATHDRRLRGIFDNPVVFPPIFPGILIRKTASGVPIMHSRLASTKRIYLDFDGCTVMGTSWNTDYSKTIITSPTWSLDSSTAFSDSEVSAILGIWGSVAEDFSSFDVDVTTEEPPLDDLRKTSSADARFGIRVCVGGSSYDWYGEGAGGLAYVGSFDWSSDTPVFVWPDNLSNAAKYIWECISHEVGHSLGLRHDGLTATSSESAVTYYAGHGDWAPIMGNSYYKPVTQFSKGDYSSRASQTQDDFAIIATYLTYLTDDHGNSPSSTFATLVTRPSTVSGVLTKPDNTDCFTFHAAAGAITANVSVLSPWGSYNRANLDVVATIYKTNTTLASSAAVSVATNDKTGSGDISGLRMLPAVATYTPSTAGRFYVCLSKASVGTASTGYTTYGSNGEYRVALSYTAPTTSTGPAPPTVTALAQTMILLKPTLTVKLTWTDNSVNEARFEVFRCSVTTPLSIFWCAFESIGNVTSTSTGGTGMSYSFSKLGKSGTYGFKVVACTSTNVCGPDDGARHPITVE